MNKNPINISSSQNEKIQLNPYKNVESQLDFVKITYKNGDQYNGQQSNKQKNGFGIFQRKDPQESYEGQWVKDQKHGKGKFINEDGIIYEGVWNNNKSNGYGTLTIPENYYEQKDYQQKLILIESFKILTKSLNNLFQKDGELLNYRGGWKDGKMDSLGIAIFCNGDRYEGDFQDGLRHGKGEYTFQDGKKYIGNWYNDLFDGQGVLSNCNIIVYQGMWKLGSMNGIGKEFYLDGSYFLGNFFQNLKEGAGKLFGKNKEVFESVWKQGTPDKICKITYEDGSTYEGEQKDYLKHGNGKILYKNNEAYLGEFFQDKKHGKGLYKYFNGATYEGDWQNDKIEGIGFYIFENRERYEGRWQSNKPNGRGKYYYENGDEYDGFWENGKQNGKGIYKYANGSIYEGSWKNGEKHGYGILINQQKVFQGDWIKNELVKGILVDKITKEIYNGQFKENCKRHGYGEQTYINGDKYHGYWENDKKRGKGTYIFSNGDSVEGVWENDEKTGKDTYKYKSNNTYSTSISEEEKKKSKLIESKMGQSIKNYESQGETEYQTKRLSQQSIIIEDDSNLIKKSRLLNSCDQYQSRYLSNSEVKHSNNDYTAQQEENKEEYEPCKQFDGSHFHFDLQKNDIGIEDFIELNKYLDKMTLDFMNIQEYNSINKSEV
ncbi:hypothetical protein ABPG74_008115 [Tetrahymena malaccensis]